MASGATVLVAAWSLASCTSAEPDQGPPGNGAADLVGTWSPVIVGGHDVSSDPNVDHWSLRFTSDGTWRRASGCGIGEGRYTLHGTDFRSHEGVDIGVGCPGPQIDYLTTLAKVATAEREGSTLLLESADGTVLLVMARAGAASNA